MMQSLKIKQVFSTDELQLLVNVGFVAISMDEPGAAADVFEAVRLLRPKQEAGYVGGALASLVAGDPGAAVQLVDGAPDTPAARTFRGLAMLRSGDVRRAGGCLRSVVEDVPFSTFALLAEQLLDQCIREGAGAARGDVIGSSFVTVCGRDVDLGVAGSGF
ncbi:MAG: hypothetical protein ABJO09_20400 [Hyphomicrobiales bacterium]